MIKKIIVSCVVIGALGAALVTLLTYRGNAPHPDKKGMVRNKTVLEEKVVQDPQPDRKRNVAAPSIPAAEGQNVSDDPGSVENIKKQIYHCNIEYTDDLDLLDDMVQPSASDPPALWDGDWVSADDWKRYDDTFRIDRDEGGNFRFTPEKDGAKSYTYDREKKEFSWDLNYYGKIVRNKARFLTKDVMVLMKISGDKVALDIYRRDKE